MNAIEYDYGVLPEALLDAVIGNFDNKKIDKVLYQWQFGKSFKVSKGWARCGNYAIFRIKTPKGIKKIKIIASFTDKEY